MGGNDGAGDVDVRGGTSTKVTKQQLHRQGKNCNCPTKPNNEMLLNHMCCSFILCFLANRFLCLSFHFTHTLTLKPTLSLKNHSIHISAHCGINYFYRNMRSGTVRSTPNLTRRNFVKRKRAHAKSMYQIQPVAQALFRTVWWP